MASNHDIREWARQNDIDVSDSGPLAADVKRAYEAYANGEEPESVLRYSTETGDDGDQEVKPVIKVTMADRVKETKARVQRPKSTRTRRATKKPAQPRVSIERVVSGAWGILGALVGKGMPAVGYIMDVQAPVAGAILEDSVKGSMIDRMIQPFARGRDLGVTVGALLGPPVCTAALQARPDMAGVILPVLRESLMMWMDVAGERVEEVRERNLMFEEKYGKTVDDIIDGLLATFGAMPADESVQHQEHQAA